MKYWINKASTKKYFIKFSDIPIDLKHAWNCIYMGVAGQGLTIAK